MGDDVRFEGLQGEATSEPRRRIEGAFAGMRQRDIHYDEPRNLFKTVLEVFGESSKYMDFGVSQYSSPVPSLDRAWDRGMEQASDRMCN